MKKRFHLKICFTFILCFTLILSPSSSFLELFLPIPKITERIFPKNLNPFNQQTRSTFQTNDKVYAATVDFPSMTIAKNNFGYQSSISALNLPTDGFAIISNNTSTQTSSLQAAISSMNSSSTDYAIYIANPNVDLTPLSTLNSSNAKSVTIIGDRTDSLANNSSKDINAQIANLPTNLSLNLPVLFRNITLSGDSTIYANGYNLAISSGAYFTGNVNLYGGSQSGSVANTNLWLNSTGSGNLTIYGGGSSGTTVQGSTAVNIKNTSGNQITVYGGGNGGTVSANTNILFESDTVGGTFNIYGGDANKGTVGASYTDVVGTNSGSLTASGNSPTGNVTGNINLGLSGLSPTTTVSTIYGDINSNLPQASTNRLITVTVNCPGIKFSQPIVATNYKLGSSNGLLASSMMNINADTVPFISGGTNGSDAFNNNNTTSTNANTTTSILKPSLNSAILNLGATTASASNVGILNCNQIFNFTTLNLEPNNQLNMSASGTFNGYIYNSGSAATTNNGTSSPDDQYQRNYSKFGAINLWENSVLVENGGPGSGKGTDAYVPSAPNIQAGTLSVSPNCYFEPPLYSYNQSSITQANQTWNSSGEFANTFSGFQLATVDQAGNTYTSESSLTWEPITTPDVNQANFTNAGIFWGAASKQAYPIISIIPSSISTSSTYGNLASPADIIGYSDSTTFGFISDYFGYSTSAASNTSNGYLIYMQSGSVREFKFNGSDSTDGSGTWNLNGTTAGGTTIPAASYSVSGVNITTGISGSSSAITSPVSAYASYFKNTVSGTTYYNLARLIYPTSAWNGSVDISPGFFQTIGSKNYITHANVQTPSLLGKSPFIQWEWPQSTSSPGGNQTTKPVTLANDPPTLNTDTSYTDYAPGVTSKADSGYIPDSTTGTNAWPYPSLSFSGMNTTGNYGFFPNGYFNGTNTISYNTQGFNSTNWQTVATSSANPSSFLIYNTTTYYTNDDGSTATPPLTSSTGRVSGAGISIQQEASIASASNTSPYNGATSTYQALKTIYNPTSTLGNSNATMTPTQIILSNASNKLTIYYNKTGANSPSQIFTSTEAEFSTALSTQLSSSTFSTVGTTITATYHSSNGNDYSGTITVQAGLLAASNVTTVTSAVNGYAKDMATALNANSSNNQIAQDLIKLTNASATDVNNNSQNGNITITGWNNGAQYNLSSTYTNNQLFQQIITDLSNHSIPAGTVFKVTFAAPSGLDGNNTQTAQITIIPGTISAQNISLTLSQAQSILKNDSTDIALASDLALKTTSVGTSGANVVATIGTDVSGNPSPAGTQLSSTATISSDGKTLTPSTSITTSLNSLIVATNNTQADQTTTLTFSTIKYGITTTINLTVIAAGSLTLKSIPSPINFGTWTTSNPPNWTNGIPEQSPSSCIAVVQDTRTTASPWQLTVTDSNTGGIIGANGYILSAGGSATSDSGVSLSNYNTPITLTNATQSTAINSQVVYVDDIPQGNNTPSGSETITINPNLFLFFPSGPLSNSLLNGTDTLTWNLTSAP